MKHTHTVFKPMAMIVFTDVEIKTLLKCSAAHYDYECKAAGQEGGFLYGINNRQSMGTDTAHELSPHQIDTLLKIMEVYGHVLRPEESGPWLTLTSGLTGAFKALNEVALLRLDTE